MTRYVAIRREPQPERSYVGDDYWKIDRASIDVIVSEKHPRRTGLLDQDGNPLYRLPPDQPPASPRSGLTKVDASAFVPGGSALDAVRSSSRAKT